MGGGPGTDRFGLIGVQTSTSCLGASGLLQKAGESVTARTTFVMLGTFSRRDHHVGASADGHNNLQGETLLVFRPTAFNWTAEGVVARPGPGQVAQHLRGNGDLLERDCPRFGRDATNGLVEPAIYDGQGRVIPRGPALPAFPRGRRTVVQHVHPTGKVRLRQYGISQIIPAARMQRLEQEPSSHYPGADVIR